MNPRLPGIVKDSLKKKDSLQRRGRVVWFDRLVVAGIVCLVVFSPLAIGSVNPWAFCTVEAVIFILTIVWMARLAIEDTPQVFPGLRPLLVPAAFFIGLILLQLIPLPSALERALSPSTPPASS